MSLSVSVKLIPGGVEIDGKAVRTRFEKIVYGQRGNVYSFNCVLTDEKGRKCGSIRVRDGIASHAVFFEPAGVVSKLSTPAQMQLAKIIAEGKMK